MRGGTFIAGFAGAALLALAASVGAQTAVLTGPGSQTAGAGCTCGAHPPGPPRDRTVAPYAGTPEDLEPFGKFTAPYYAHYTHPNLYSGAARDVPDPKDLSEVRIGFLGPVEKQEDQVFGLRMLHGAQLAVDEANARGGYGGKPFRLMVHDDYNNWQRGAEYGERPTDAAIWGSPADEAVKMIYDEGDWAIFGSVSSESTHIILRVALRAEIPIVNSASTDPTIPETYIPWYFTDLQDDRVQSYTLARRIFTELGLKRAALLRVNNRYGRLGVVKFRDAARRLGHPVVIEQKFLPGDTDYRRALRIIRDSRADAIVVWADEAEAAAVLKQMRELGMKQRVFGSYRTLGDTLLADAGSAAEGFEAVYPYDPTRSDPRWTEFEQRYGAQYGEKPEAFAALAYDAMNVLLGSICRAGLNRARIQDALDQVYRYNGVTGPMVFDPLNKNVSPMYLGTVHEGKITYRVATVQSTERRAQSSEKPGTGLGTQGSADADGTASVEIHISQRRIEPSTGSGQVVGLPGNAASAGEPYARVGEDGVGYAGPHRTDIAGTARIVIFGARAGDVAKSDDVRTALTERHWIAVGVDSGQNWGAATTQLVGAVGDGRALAVVALDRDAAHLAEQLAIKFFLPVVAIADDAALTSTNVPWIFRLPGGSQPAAAVRVLAAAARRSGANPERLRDVLASGAQLADVRFRDTGEPLVGGAAVALAPGAAR